MASMIRSLSRRMAGALCLLAAAAWGHGAAAQSIDNTAFASWNMGGIAGETQSNRVSVAVQTASFTLATFRLAPDSGASVTYFRSQCTTGAQASVGQALTATIAPTTEVRLGEAIIFEVTAQTANRDPAVIDNLTVLASSSQGGQVRLVVFETGPDTARFVGSIGTSLPGETAGADDCRLAVNQGGQITIALDEGNAGGLPVSANVTIIEPATGPSPLGLTLGLSRQRAQPGETLLYSLVVRNSGEAGPEDGTVTVDLPAGIRLRGRTITIDGLPAGDAVRISADGRRLEIAPGLLPAGSERRIGFAAAIAANAPPGRRVTIARLIDTLGRNSLADAMVEIEREGIAARMTIIGQVLSGPCTSGEAARGIGGVRVIMEDGSFAITDADGRYRLEGVTPGTHVVQVVRGTLPAGTRLVDCSGSTRSAGDPGSRFVIAQGGSLARADFHVVDAADESQPRINVARDLMQADVGQDAPTLRTASTLPETDWLSLGDGPDGWLTPDEDANPRVPAIKVAFRHRAGQTIRLYADGKPVDPVTFDGTLTSADGRYAVSLWRGIALPDERTVLAAEIVNSLGGVNARLEREVFFTSQPANVALVAAQSLLVADGVTRPVVTVRITDRRGRPVREGISGEFLLSAPFESAAQIELQQIRQLSGVGEASARWVIEGDDGLARIELAPTMVSGALRIAFLFNDGNLRRRQEIEAWVVPGAVEWTIVGLGEATAGARSVADNMETGTPFDSDLGQNARIALYAKGRVLGKYLLTFAYDSAKQRGDQPLLGAIDPAAYYTVFADGSQRRFDAASREKLYIRIETATFLALYGDFQTGFDETTLGRYQRTATGIRAEARLGAVRAEAFGAAIGSRFRRDEFQGNGLAGPYPLGNRDILINSERVTIEVRDRFRPEVIVSARSLARFTDYRIDVLSGTITFSEPVLSRDPDLNPQIVVIEYETAGSGDGAINAGVRADWTSDDGALRVGATAITEQGDAERTTMGVADARLKVGETTEFRGEIAVSDTGGTRAQAWLAEVQHQTGRLGLTAYARAIDAGYGTGQQSLAETGRRMIGADARYQIDDRLAATISALDDRSLAGDGVQRRGGRAELAWRSPSTDARIGLARFDDRPANGEGARSTVLEAAATQRLLDNRLELSGATSIALDQAQSLDLPPRHRLGLRYAVTPDVRLTGTYEIADSTAIRARTLRAGIEVTPWQGGRMVTTLGRNEGDAGSAGRFAGFGLAQTIAVSPTLTLDATLDGNRTLGNAPSPGGVINPAQPPASGGPLAIDRTLFEDFTAVTLGGTWRAGRWTANGRGEYRDGQLADRRGLTLGVIRQLGEGRAFGGNLVWTEAEAPGGSKTAITDVAITLAHRPQGSDLSLLGRIEYRSDRVTGAAAGMLGPAGRTALDLTGDALARRLVGSLSANWSPRVAGGSRQLSEIGLFLGTRYSLDRLGTLDLAGFTALAGLDLRLGLNEWLDIGGSASIRANVTDGSYSYAVGPQASLVVADGALLSLGYNVAGFRDPDFSTDRPLDEGLFASIRFKFDAGTLGLAPNSGTALRDNPQ